MMKCCAILALLAVYVYGAPTGLTGGLNANPSGGSASLAAGGASSSINVDGTNVDAATKVKGFKAVLYLFAPDSWINTFNSISEEGQECFLNRASNPANQKIYNGEDTDAIKSDLTTNCPTAATELGNFADQTASTFKSLPASFLALAKTWGDSMQTLGEQVKQAAAQNPGVKGAEAMTVFKPYIKQFSTATATFLSAVAALPDADRQQISTAFPKLQAFFSGSEATNFLNQAAGIYKLLSADNVDTAALKTQGEQFKQTLKTVFQQYATANADGLKQASSLLGTDLTQAGNMMNAQSDVAAGSSGFGGFGASHAQFASLLNQGTDEAKSKWAQIKGNVAELKGNVAAKAEEGKQNFQAWVQNAKQSEDWQKVQENWNQLKQTGQQNWNDLKTNVKEGTDALKNKLNGGGAPNTFSANVNVQ